MCTVLLPPGDNPIAVNKYIISKTLFHMSYPSFKDTRSNSEISYVSKLLLSTSHLQNFSIRSILILSFYLPIFWISEILYLKEKYIDIIYYMIYLLIAIGLKPGGSSTVHKKVKVKQSRNRPGGAQRVPRGLGSQISMTFGPWRWRSCQPHAPDAFTPRKFSWYSFLLEAESTPGPCYGRKEICHWKIQWHHWESIPGPSN